MKTKTNRIWIYYEKLRAFLLIFLIMLCIIQVGILWSGQSGSFPFSIFGGPTSAPASLEDSKGDYLLPYRVVLSKGYDDNHYLISNGSKEYTDLWEGAKLYIAEALKTKPKQSQVFSEDTWGSLAAKKPYFFEFKTVIPVDIFKWVLEMDNSTGEGISGIYKVLICPDDPDNGYSDTVYIRDDKNIYTYLLSDVKSIALSAGEFKKILMDHDNDLNSRSYRMAIESNNKIFPQDMLLPMSSSSIDSYVNFTCLPYSNIDEQSSSLSDYDLIARDLFGNDRNDFDPDQDVYGSVVFKNLNSVYRLYKNSVLEYKYTGKQGSYEKSKVLEAYKNALNFIIRHKDRSASMSNINVYLKSIEEGNNSYIFNFDFAITSEELPVEIPILLKGYKLPGTEKSMEYAISIEASSKRVINCRWLLLKYKFDRENSNYQWSFFNMFDRVFDEYPALKDAEETTTQDYGIFYVLSYPKTHGHQVKPSFVLFSNNGSYDVLLNENNK